MRTHTRARVVVFLVLALLSTGAPLRAQTNILSGTYVAATLTGDVATNPGSSATFTAGTTFTGPNANFGANSNLIWQQTGTLSGKSIVFGNGAYVYLNATSASLTLDATTTATGDLRVLDSGVAGTVLTNQGTLTHNHASSGELYAKTFTNSGTITATASNLQIGSTSASYSTLNSGTITANGSGVIVYLDGNVSNTGSLNATNSGQLVFRGDNTSANLGTVNLSSGGRALINSTNLTIAGTLNPPASGIYELSGGKVSGGTIAGNALTTTSGGGTLNGVTLTGAFNLPANTDASIAGNTVFNGATVTFGNSAYLYLSSAAATLTFDPTTTATGDLRVLDSGVAGTVLTNQGTLTHNHGSSGELYAKTFTNSGTITATASNLQIGSTSASYSTFNSGTITANGSGVIVYLDGNVSNTGSLNATNSGQLVFRGDNSSANLGTVNLSSGGRALINSTNLTISGTLNPPASGIYELSGGKVSGGTIAGNALTTTSGGGTLNGVTLTGAFNLPANTDASIAGNTVFNGASVTFGSSAYLYLNNTAAALTFDPTTTGTGDLRVLDSGVAGTVLTNQGTLTHNHASSGELYAKTFTNSGTITATASNLQIGSTNASYSTLNSGTITANGSGVIVYLDGNVSNTGSLNATNSGQLVFRGDNSSANLGTVNLSSGGRALINSSNLTISGTLNPPASGIYELSGGKVSGGTIAGNALTTTSSGGVLNGTTLTGAVNLPANTHASIAGNTVFNGATVTFGNSAYLYLNVAAGSLTFDGTTIASGDLRVLDSGVSGTVLTNQGTLTHNHASSGELYARTFTNSGAITAAAGTLQIGTNSASYSTVNSGTITANGSGVIVYLEGNVSNTGTLAATNSGKLAFRGTNSQGISGAIQLSSGGSAEISGTIVNTTLAAPTGGAFQLVGGTIQGGTIAPGALTFTNFGGYLDGATLNDNLNLPANSYVRFTGGASLTGATGSFASNSGVYWEQVGTLSGKAFTFATGAYFYLNGNNNALTLGPTSSITGDVSIYPSGSSGTAFTNQGTLTHTGGSSSIYAGTFTNTGSITANAGTLYLGSTSGSYSSANSGTVTASGSGTTVYLRGNFANTGTLAAQNSGTLRFDGTNSTGNLGNVQLSTGGRAQLAGTLVNSSLNAPSGGAFELTGGTLQGGTVAPGALTFTNSGGYLDGATLNDNLNLPANSYVRFTGGASFTGATGSFASNSGVYWEQVGTLSGKAFTFATGAYFYLNGNNNALTLGPTSSITGDVSIYPSGSSGTAFTNQGTLTHTGGSSSIYAGTFTNTGSITANAGTLYLGSTSGSYSSANSGSITASGSGTTVYLRGNFANTGTLAAQNSGTLRFDGTNSTGNLGNVQLSTGGRAQLAGTLVNSSLNAPSGGTFELTGGTLQGGTVAPAALTFTNSGGYLDGATLNDNLNLPANSYVRFTGGASFTGATGSFASNSGVYWEQVGTLSGKAFTFATGAYFYLNGNNNALTLGPTSSITGDVSIYPSGSSGTAFTNQGTLTHTGGSSSIYAGTFTNTGSITANAGTLFLGSTSGSHNSANSGTVTANGSGTTVYLRGNFANTGTLVAQNSAALRFDGDNTTANFGNVQLASGGRALLSGNFSNSHLAAPTGGAFELAGGTLTGGTVAPGALGFTSSGGYLDGVTLSGNLTLVAGSSYVRFLNGTTFTGSSASIASNAGIYWDQSGTLSGKSLTLGSSAYVYVVGAGHSLALDSATTATGALNFYSDGSTGTVISNQGNLTHTTGSGSLYAAAFTNSGTITATAGTLYLGYNSGTSSFANLPSGTIAVSGGTVQLRASSGNFVVNQGAINVQGGTLQTNNVLINAPGGTVSGAGTLSGGVTFTGGTLAPGNSVGTLTLTNSTFAVTGATTFAVELGGATSDLLLFQNPPTNVNLGSGLVSLSLNLLAPPTAATYDLIRIGSGSNVITGNFAGLPASGATLNASFGGNPYTFSITYQPSVIQLNFVAIPEPSTYALLATGAAAVLFLRRRRR